MRRFSSFGKIWRSIMDSTKGEEKAGEDKH